MYSPWITAYKDNVYNLKVSLDDDLLCIHCSVHGKVNSRNLKVLEGAFKEVCSQLEGKGFHRIYAHTPDLRFVRLVTGDTFHYITDIEGQPFIVWEFEEYLYG